MSKIRSRGQCAALVIGELAKGPATIKSMCIALGVPGNRTDRIQTYLAPMREAGTVRICAWLTQQQPQFELQTIPFGKPDEPKPGKRAPKRKTSRRMSDEERERRSIAIRRAKEPAVKLGPNSVFAMVPA